MQSELINASYIQELIELSQDQNEPGLVSQLFSRLEQSRNEFFLSVGDDSAQLAFRLHKLKNQFANLGCLAASLLLEEMYQIAKNQNVEGVRNLLPHFKQLSEETFQKLRLELKY
jgi:hypothetical protein